MAQNATKTLARLSKIKEFLGVTEELDVAPGYIMLGGLATLMGQVHEMNRMLVSLLDKEKVPPPSCKERS